MADEDIEIIEVKRGDAWFPRIALALSAVAFSGMGLFLIQWGEDQQGLRDHRQLDQHPGQVRVNKEIRKELHEIDKKVLGNRLLLKGIDEKIDELVEGEKE